MTKIHGLAAVVAACLAGANPARAAEGAWDIDPYDCTQMAADAKNALGMFTAPWSAARGALDGLKGNIDSNNTGGIKLGVFPYLRDAGDWAKTAKYTHQGKACSADEMWSVFKQKAVHCAKLPEPASGSDSTKTAASKKEAGGIFIDLYDCSTLKGEFDVMRAKLGAPMSTSIAALGFLRADFEKHNGGIPVGVGAYLTDVSDYLQEKLAVFDLQTASANRLYDLFQKKLVYCSGLYKPAPR